MKRIFAVLLLACIGCGENKENQEEQGLSEEKVLRDSIPGIETKTPQKSFLCFFATENDTPSSNLRDSIILNLEVTGEVVSGNFNWIPAEKDSRRGVIQGTKTGDEIKGNYSYTQEGLQDTISIEIRLQGTSAMINTLSPNGEAMTMEVERVDCQ